MFFKFIIKNSLFTNVFQIHHQKFFIANVFQIHHQKFFIANVFQIHHQILDQNSDDQYLSTIIYLLT